MPWSANIDNKGKSERVFKKQLDSCNNNHHHREQCAESMHAPLLSFYVQVYPFTSTTKNQLTPSWQQMVASKEYRFDCAKALCPFSTFRLSVLELSFVCK